MAQEKLRNFIPDYPTRDIIFKIIRWTKFLAILGLGFQLLTLAFAWVQYHLYLKYAAIAPTTAQSYLSSCIFGLAQVVVYTTIFSCTLRWVALIQRSLSETGTEKDFSDALRLNLRVLKIQFATILATALYQSTVLIKMAKYL